MRDEAAFDRFAVVDWSAGRRATRKKADAIWMGHATQQGEDAPRFLPDRHAAERLLVEMFDDVIERGERLLIGFDFPFGYPRGTARRVTGTDHVFALWDWLEARITDDADGVNNRFEVAEELNALFDGPGPFWGKPDPDRWPAVPYRKAGIPFDPVPEKRLCDARAKAASSCFQLYFPPTVGGQILMGLPVLARLRRRFRDHIAVWPFEDWRSAPIVLTEIWPGLIEPAVKSQMAREGRAIRDAVQVQLLSRALARLPSDTLEQMLDEVPDGPPRREEAWILGAGHRDCLLATFDATETLESPA